MEYEQLKYQGIKIETPFEWQMRQNALNRQTMEEEREANIELQAQLLKFKYEEYLLTQTNPQ